MQIFQKVYSCLARVISSSMGVPSTHCGNLEMESYLSLYPHKRER